MKTKIKSYGDEARDFHDREIPKECCNCTSLAVITIDSALKRDENYYPQALLKDCKWIKKEVIRYITGDIEVFLSDCNEEYIKSNCRDVFETEQFSKMSFFEI